MARADAPEPDGRPGEDPAAAPRAEPRADVRADAPAHAPPGAVANAPAPAVSGAVATAQAHAQVGARTDGAASAQVGARTDGAAAAPAGVTSGALPAAAAAGVTSGALPADPPASAPDGPAELADPREPPPLIDDLKAVGSKLLKDPIGGVQQGVQQVVGALKARRGVALGWAAALIAAILCYVVDLGAGSVWNGDDAQVALLVRALSQGTLSLADVSGRIPPPTGVPLALWELAWLVRLFAPTEAVLRLLPALAALGCALCLLAIAIDVGVGRHAGGLGGLVLLALPLTYELSHRVLPDMLIAFAATGAVALTSHCLHGHRFDRHVLPHQRDEEAPAPLPLRRWPMVFCALGIGAAALVDPRAGMTAIAFGVLDVLLAHRHLLRKRRVWLALGTGALLTTLVAGLRPGGLSAWLVLPLPGEASRNVAALWSQGSSWYGRHVGQVVIVAAGFGLLLGSLRRASRPLLAWMVVATFMTWLGDVSPPPRGLGLALPPLALCAAVGLESPVRWLGHLGMIVSSAAIAGIFLVVTEGGPVLHRDDTVKALSLSQRRAQPGTLRCAVGLNAAAPSLYNGSEVRSFASVQALKDALAPEQPFSCLMPAAEADTLQRLMAPAPVTPVPAAPPQAAGARRVKPAPPPPARPESVLATVLDREEPPPDTQGPAVVLVSR